MHKLPSIQYQRLLDIKAIIRKWQDLDITDDEATIQIKFVVNYKIYE